MEIIKDVQRQIVLWIILAVSCLVSLGIAVFVNHVNNIVQWSTFFIIAGSIFGFFILVWWFWILYIIYLGQLHTKKQTKMLDTMIYKVEHLRAEVYDFVENIVLEWKVRKKIKKIKPKKD